MRIELLELRRGLDRLDLSASPEELALPESWFQQPVRVRLAFHALDEGWQVVLDIRTRASRVCDRCLADVEVPVAESERCLILPDSAHPGLEEEDRVLLFKPDQETIELDQIVRDVLRLAQPEYFFCAETCKGLCPQCGQDLNEADCGCRPAAPASPLQALASLRRPSETT